MSDRLHLGIVLACLVSAVALTLACQSTPTPTAAAYEAQVLSVRAEKDQFFRESSESPIPPERRAVFLPLSYFPLDVEYRVPAALRVSEDQPEFKIPTSTGQLRPVRQIGTLEFSVKGQALTLLALIDLSEGEDMSRLFVPFGDLTNGTETYPAGRYLDLSRTPTGLYDLDFNRAYHPYCYYNETYDCPYPPAASRLKIPIRAGERLPPS